jgi:hypothetical protein
MKEVNNMLANLIKELEKSDDLRNAWEDFTDVLVVQKLKESYLNTLNGGISSHPEDIAETKQVNEAIAVCLGYFMYVVDAQDFLQEANNASESN